MKQNRTRALSSSKFNFLFFIVATVAANRFPSVYAKGLEPCPVATAQSKPVLPAYDRIILIPGAGAQNADLYVGPFRWKEYFSEYVPYLESAHIPFQLHAVSPTGNEGIEQRIENLKKQIIQAQSHHERVLLLGHSIGGLVSRLVLRDHSLWGAISAVLMLSAPNQGTELVEAVNHKDSTVPWLEVLSRVLGFDLNHMEYMNEVSHASAIKKWITEEDFAEGMPPVYSIVSSDQMVHLYEDYPFMGIGGQWIAGELSKLAGPEQMRLGVWGTTSDGVVPAYSQVWGQCIGWFKGSHARILGKVLVPYQKQAFNDYMADLMGFLKP